MQLWIIAVYLWCSRPNERNITNSKVFFISELSYQKIRLSVFRLHLYYLVMVFVWSRREGLAVFLILYLTVQQPMTKRSESVSNANNSTIATRVPQRNEGKKLSSVKELQRQLKQVRQELEIEKNCKNEAYYFILSDGAFRKFAEFHKKYRANLDYHGACLAQLYLDSFEK